MSPRRELEKLLALARRKILLERLAWGIGGWFILLAAFSVVAAAVLSAANFSALALFWTRMVLVVAVIWSAWRLLARPTIRRPTASQVARFLEERFPQLQQRLSTVVEISQRGQSIRPELAELICADAWEKVRLIPQPRLFRPRAFAMAIGLAAASLGIGSLLYFAGPVEYRYSLRTLASGWSDENDTALYRIVVEPGSISIPARSDLRIHAYLQGFDASAVRLQVRYPGEAGWDSVVMPPDLEKGGTAYALFDLREPVDYYVEADGIRSEVFRVEIIDAPRVASVVFNLSFPAYTGLGQVTLDNERELRAVKGTRVRAVVTFDRPTEAAALRFENGPELALSSGPDGGFTADFEISADDVFRVTAADRDGVIHPASDEYTIEALDDTAPALRMVYPGRDKPVTSLEEVYVEVSASDDFGVEDLSLAYSVNGGKEERIRLGIAKGERQVSASHTFLLEDFGLQPGDVVSYYALSHDAVSSASTDIYFLEVRPFDREFRQSQIAAGGGQAGDRGLELSRRQKQIVVGTFSLIRDRERFEETEFSENAQTLALVQQRLAAELQTIVERFERREMSQLDPRFGKMQESLKSALEHMKPAEIALNAGRPEMALPEAQKALQSLMRAEALFTEVQVSMAAGGPDSPASAEDLADLVDLELDKTKNQYETLQQSEEEKADKALDEALEKLKELAKRQEQEVERERRKGIAGSSSSGRSSAQQTAEELERIARELARLSRRKDQPQLSRLSQELNRAARELKEGRTSGQGTGRSLEMAEQALERLKRAQQALDGERRSDLEQRLAELNERAEQLVGDQNKVVQGLSEMEAPKPGERPGEEYIKRLRELFWQKQGVEQALQELEGELHQTARRIQAGEPQASRKLRDAAIGIRESRLPEKVREGTELMAAGMIGLAQRREEGVASELKQLQEQVRDAAASLGAAGSNQEEKIQEALQATGDLVENLESLRKRLEESARSNSPGQESSEDPEGGNGAGIEAGEQLVPQPRSGEAGGRASSGINPSQVRREWGQRLNEAEAIRRQLGQVDSQLEDSVERLARQMKGTDLERVLDDPGELRNLRLSIIDGFHQLELVLRSKLSSPSGEFLRPVDQDNVPPEYRDRVSEYYRRLATRRDQDRN